MTWRMRAFCQRGREPMKTGSAIVLIISFIFLVLLGVPSLSEAAQSPMPGELRLVESNTQHVVLELTAPELVKQERQINGETYLALSAMGWGNLKLPGKPQVPIKGVLVAIPQSVQVRLSIVQDRKHTQILPHPVLPAPTEQAFQPDPNAFPQFQGLVYRADSATYSASTPYPSDAVSSSSPADWRSQRYVRVQFNPFQFNPVTRELVTHEHLKIELDFTAPNIPDSELGQRVDEGGFETILQKTLINYSSAKQWRSAKARTPNIGPGESAASSNNSFKIAVKVDGIYKVTCDALQAAGLVLNSVNTDTFHLSFMGNEVAIDMTEDGDKLCEPGEFFTFFGQGPTDPNVPYNVYWLSFGGNNGKRMSLSNVTGGITPSSYTKTVHLEQNLQYATFAPWNGNADHYVWEPVNHPFDPDGNGDNTSVDISVPLNDLATGTTNGTLRVLVQSGSTANPYNQRQLTLLSNGVQVYQQNWLLGQSLLATAGVTNLTSGSNTFRVKDLPWAGGYWVYLNYLELDYSAQFKANNDMLRFKYADSGTWQYQVTDFTNSNLVAYDITDPTNLVKFSVSTTSG